jgi:hypothetical protein
MFLIGLTGRAGSGKDTAAAALISELSFQRFAFADPIKEGLSAMFGWDPARWSDREWKESALLGRNYSPRNLAQTLGTEWGRKIVHPDIWVHALESQINLFAHDRVVITDVRFDNEARWIHEQGGWVIEVLRPDAAPVSEHASEVGIYPALIDFSILNDRTVEALQQRVIAEVSKKLFEAAA